MRHCSPATAAVTRQGSRFPTSSPTCVSTRLGVLPRSWVPCMTSVRATTPPAHGVRAAAAGGGANTTSLRLSGRRVGLGRRCRHDPEDAVGCQGHPLRSDRVCRRCEHVRCFHLQQPCACIVTTASRIGAFTRCRVRQRRRLQTAGVGNSLELTKTWGGTLAFEHYWTPSLRTSWVAGYLEVEYYGQREGAAGQPRCRRCALATGVTLPDQRQQCCQRLTGRCGALPRGRCGTRLQNLDVGLEVAYTKVNTAFGGAGDIADRQPRQLRPVGWPATTSTTTRTGLPPSACSATSGHEPRLAVI